MTNHAGAHWVAAKDLVLLVRSSSSLPRDLPSLEVLGKRYCVIRAAELPGGLAEWKYTCVSYSWGEGTAAHPLSAGRRISDRALPGIEAVIRARDPVALWVDALCMPQDEDALAATLRHLGAIYAEAQEVVAVLSEPGSKALVQVATTRSLDEAALKGLEQDDWVARAWTYQEIVNSRRLSFVSATSDGVVVHANELLNRLMTGLAELRKKEGYDPVAMQASRPRLDALEEVLGDYMSQDSLARSAYQVLSAMYRRSATTSEHLFDAMLGAIGSPSEAGSRADPRQLFLSVCDTKGDFSYIYAVGEGGRGPGHAWLPPLGLLHAVLPWHSHGPGQAGSLQAEHLQLAGMFLPRVGPITESAKTFVETWARRQRPAAAAGSLPELLLPALKQAGFTGSGDYVECDSGYFFLQNPPPEGQDLCVAIATAVRWVQGGPGLSCWKRADGLYQFCSVGAFVGLVPKEGQQLRLAHAPSGC